MPFEVKTLHHVINETFRDGSMGDYGHVDHCDQYFDDERMAEFVLNGLGGKESGLSYSRRIAPETFVVDTDSGKIFRMTETLIKLTTISPASIEFKEFCKHLLRKQALAKLTVEERESLGFQESEGNKKKCKK